MSIEKSKIHFKIKKHHYIGLIITQSITINKQHNIVSKINNDAIYLNNTSLYINRFNQYPIFKIDSELFDKNFKYKKYIRNILNNDFKIKSKYIITIKLVNTQNNLHNYIVVLNNINKLDKGTNILNTNDNLFHWKTILDMYKPHSHTTQNNVYNFILNKSKFIIYPELFTNKNTHNEYYIEYNTILDILTSVTFGY